MDNLIPAVVPVSANVMQRQNSVEHNTATKQRDLPTARRFGVIATQRTATAVLCAAEIGSGVVLEALVVGLGTSGPVR